MAEPKHPFPATSKTMLASLTRDAFADPDWLYEIKWDGYQFIAQVQKGKVILYSREGHDYTSKYKAVALKRTICFSSFNAVGV